MGRARPKLKRRKRLFCPRMMSRGLNGTWYQILKDAGNEVHLLAGLGEGSIIQCSQLACDWEMRCRMITRRRNSEVTGVQPSHHTDKEAQPER